MSGRTVAAWFTRVATTTLLITGLALLTRWPLGAINWRQGRRGGIAIGKFRSAIRCGSGLHGRCH